MRYIPTSAATVEGLKKQAKRLQRKNGGKHTDLLNSVAKRAGYEHWHHVTICQEQFEQLRGVELLEAECDLIVRAAREGGSKIIVTGPEVLPVPFILFASQGDAWLLEPEDDLAICLMFRGQEMPRVFRDSEQQIAIAWDGDFKLDGDAFAVRMENPMVGTRVILGYPLDELRAHLDKAHSFHKRFHEIFMPDGAEDLTPALIDKLVSQGWERKALEEGARDGARYNPARDSLMYPAIAGGFEDDDDERLDG